MWIRVASPGKALPGGDVLRQHDGSFRVVRHGRHRGAHEQQMGVEASRT